MSASLLLDFEDIILNSKKYAQPLKNILLGINTMIVSQAKQYTNSGEKLEGSLVLVTSPIFALENFRTVVNIFKEDYRIKEDIERRTNWLTLTKLTYDICSILLDILAIKVPEKM